MVARTWDTSVALLQLQAVAEEDQGEGQEVAVEAEEEVEVEDVEEEAAEAAVLEHSSFLSHNDLLRLLELHL